MKEKYLKYFQKSNDTKTNFEPKQNLVGFFSLLLEVAKRDPEIWERICKESDENKKTKLKNDRYNNFTNSN